VSLSDWAADAPLDFGAARDRDTVFRRPGEARAHPRSDGKRAESDRSPERSIP
jgi:hypothetical protein